MGESLDGRSRPGFGVAVTWDVPLLDRDPFMFLENKSSDRRLRRVVPGRDILLPQTGHSRVLPAVPSTWGEGLEPVRAHSMEALRDTTKKYRHKAQIAVGEGLLALCQRLCHWFGRSPS
jgi:hypothetical protein